MQTVGSLLQKGLKLHPVVKMGIILSVFVSLVPLPCLAGWNSFSIFTEEMTSIAMDPNDAERVYAGTRNAGVFRTINGGKTWQAARKGLNFYPVRSLAVAPSQPSTIYAGTDFDGVWKSLDGGDTWAKTSHGLPKISLFSGWSFIQRIPMSFMRPWEEVVPCASAMFNAPTAEGLLG